MRLEQDDVDVLVGSADGDPPEAAVRHVDSDLEAEGVAVEGERRRRVLDRDEHCGDGDCHAGSVETDLSVASPILLGSVRSDSGRGRLGLWLSSWRSLACTLAPHQPEQSMAQRDDMAFDYVRFAGGDTLLRSGIRTDRRQPVC